MTMTAASTSNYTQYLGAGATQTAKPMMNIIGSSAEITPMPLQIPKHRLEELVKKHKPPAWWYGQKEDDLF
jgi:hypothetical protein